MLRKLSGVNARGGGALSFGLFATCKVRRTWTLCSCSQAPGLQKNEDFPVSLVSE